MSRIVISALGPSIQEQCDKLGMAPTKMRIETIERLSHWLTIAHIHDVLTDAEVSRARLRLMREKYLPSNGTEGEIFFDDWCRKCARDRSMRDGAPVEDCDDAAMAKDQK